VSSPAPAAALGEVGRVVADLEISRAWLVDPASGREGPGEIVVVDGVLEAVTWLDAGEADGIDDRGVIVAPGFVDLHVHLREPGNEDAETIVSGLAAAAHGGFTTVVAMPNTTPALDDPSLLERLGAAAVASGSPVRTLAWGAISSGRAGETLAALGELADAGVAGFSDDGAPVASPVLMRNALAYAGALGLPIVEHAEDPALTSGAEANDGYISTVLGLRGCPAAAEEAAVARDLALLADVVRDVPGARLHLTHLSTAGALDLVRRAKAVGLPVTCDVTPHHLALSDEWLAGARRWAWEGSGDPWADGETSLVAAPYASSLRVNPPLRSVQDAASCREALLDGTADAIATDHAPHASVDKDVEFGLALNGISGLETALGVVLAMVDAGLVPLALAIRALTTGPAAVLGSRWGDRPLPGLVEGAPADLVVFDRSSTWSVSADALASRGKNTPLLGRDLPGPVLATVAGGRLAYEASDPTDG
jgi:dihydroorotase